MTSMKTLALLELHLQFVFCIVVMGLVVSPVVLGDNFHYRNTLMGDRAAALGGAFVAIADDPSGAFYNPAGMCLSTENYFSLSVNAFQTGSETYKNVFAGKNYSYKSGSLMPSMFGFTSSLGKGKKMAFTIFVKDYEIIDQNDTITEITAITDRTYGIRRQLAIETSTYYLGPSYSFQLNSASSLGASLFTVFHQHRTVDLQFQTFNPAGTGKYSFQNVYINRHNISLLPKVGTIFAPTQKLSIGAAVSKPFYLSSGGRYRIQRTSTDAATGLPVAMTGAEDNDVDILESSTLTLRLLGPWEFDTGVAYFWSDRTLFSADFIFYTDDPKFQDNVTVPTYNWSVGAETYLNDRLPIRLGLFSNNPNIPAVKAGLKNQLPYVKLLGISGGISFLSPGSSVSITSVYSFGSGQGQVVSNSTAVQEVSKSNLAVMLSGSYQM